MSFVRMSKRQQEFIERLITRRRKAGQQVTAELIAELLPPLPSYPPRIDPPRNLAAMYARQQRERGQRGFTLIELLVVIVIIIIVSAVALPVVLPAMSHRQVSEAARQLQSALAGCRDSALRTGSPSGLRLLADPAFPVSYAAGGIDATQPLAFNRWVPVEPAAPYTEGAVSVYPQFGYPTTVTGGLPAVVLEQSLGQWVQPAPGAPYHFQVQSPTSWFWNLRVGEKVQVNGTGPWYTICGPMQQPNPEGFVNVGPAGTASPWNRQQTAPDNSQTFPTQPEYLLVTNGIDDNADGYIDSGYDGTDNNGDGTIDELAEWEPERWLSTAAPIDGPYTVQRRPAPIAGAREQSLPTNVVVDATTWASSRSRSRLPVDPSTGSVELLVRPDGAVQFSSRYGQPTAIGMDAAFLHFWLAERSDVGTGQPPAGNWYLVSVTARTGRISSTENPDPANPFVAAQQGAR
jgi:prepilin-type N-terminal cleavage/methylation domain-containing protein